MSKEETAIRLAAKLLQFTTAGKITWVDAGTLGPWGERPGRVFKASVDARTFAQIAEVPVPRSLITSYYFGVAEGKPEIFEINAQERPEEFIGVFAEGYPADPTDTKLKLLSTLKDLYLAAHDSAKGTQQKVEKFEQLLERLA